MVQKEKRFECKYRGRIGPAEADDTEMRILNRIVTWTTDGIQYEGNQRHVETAMKEWGLNEESIEFGVPGINCVCRIAFTRVKLF